ncbi:MAG: FAD-binding oxidoreductase, partial [Clostridiaceae bacterium]
MDIEELVKLTKLPKSFWMDSVPKTAYASLKEDLRVDVAIVGGGITGILSALLLGNYGLKVAILEGGHILQSTTGHTTAKITSQHGLIYNKIKSKIGTELARQYADANETAIRMIEKIAKENNIQCDFIPQSSYVYTMLDEYIEKIN